MINEIMIKRKNTTKVFLIKLRVLFNFRYLEKTYFLFRGERERKRKTTKSPALIKEYKIIRNNLSFGNRGKLIIIGRRRIYAKKKIS